MVPLLPKTYQLAHAFHPNFFYFYDQGHKAGFVLMTTPGISESYWSYVIIIIAYKYIYLLATFAHSIVEKLIACQET